MGFAKRAKDKGRIPGGFVPLTWNMLNSLAYIKLPPSAAKALPYFIGKVKLKDYAAHYTVTFSFSYGEAKKLGFARATHHRTICALVENGFLDPYRRGGMKGLGYSCSEFKLSNRWEKFDTQDFEKVTWTQFLPKTKASSKMEPYRSKSGTDLLEKGL